MNMKAGMNKSFVKIFLANKNSTCTYHMKEMQCLLGGELMGQADDAIVTSERFMHFMKKK